MSLFAFELCGAFNDSCGELVVAALMKIRRRRPQGPTCQVVDRVEDLGVDPGPSRSVRDLVHHVSEGTVELCSQLYDAVQ